MLEVSFSWAKSTLKYVIKHDTSEIYMQLDASDVVELILVVGYIRTAMTWLTLLRNDFPTLVVLIVLSHR